MSVVLHRCAASRSLRLGHTAAKSAANAFLLWRPTDLGVSEADLARVADEVLANPYSNPRPVTRPELLALLQSAWGGRA